MVRVPGGQSLPKIAYVDPYQCRKCGKCFSQRAYLTRHRETFHQSTSNAKHLPPCQNYGRFFFRRVLLKEHIFAFHEGRKPFTCQKCGKAFTRRTRLNAHISVVHTKERRFTCEICGNCFTQRCNLNTHISEVHERREPFTCQMCSKAFSSRAGLNAHISTLHKSEFTNSSTIFLVDFWVHTYYYSMVLRIFLLCSTFPRRGQGSAMAKDVVADPINVRFIGSRIRVCSTPLKSSSDLRNVTIKELMESAGKKCD
ncbi:Zinc finger protein [Echinococcus granulosus]|uniref:Zinc finger protein n=1 Tax=Echinococcus granulosus TaxID=6210 RepID=W6U254_ECHGR|nr:Zinc finger protein [Echinococcus granulosus]EUB55190.1 Zinc finger protein [Echinococcus granulosus]